MIIRTKLLLKELCWIRPLYNNQFTTITSFYLYKAVLLIPYATQLAFLSLQLDCPAPVISDFSHVFIYRVIILNFRVDCPIPIDVLIQTLTSSITQWLLRWSLNSHSSIQPSPSSYLHLLFVYLWILEKLILLNHQIPLRINRVLEEIIGREKDTLPEDTPLPMLTGTRKKDTIPIKTNNYYDSAELSHCCNKWEPNEKRDSSPPLPSLYYHPQWQYIGAVSPGNKLSVTLLAISLPLARPLSQGFSCWSAFDSLFSITHTRCGPVLFKWMRKYNPRNHLGVRFSPSRPFNWVLPGGLGTQWTNKWIKLFINYL